MYRCIYILYIYERSPTVKAFLICSVRLCTVVQSLHWWHVGACCVVSTANSKLWDAQCLSTAPLFG